MIGRVFRLPIKFDMSSGLTIGKAHESLERFKEYLKENGCKFGQRVTTEGGLVNTIFTPNGQVSNQESGRIEYYGEVVIYDSNKRLQRLVKKYTS